MCPSTAIVAAFSIFPSVTRLLADQERFRGAELLHQLPDRLGPIGDRSQRSHLAAWLRDGNGDRISMEIETEKSYLAHDRLLSHVALRWGLQLAA